jgi:hypothetical protein
MVPPLQNTQLQWFSMHTRYALAGYFIAGLLAAGVYAEDNTNGLPEGEGKRLLVQHCLNCHELEEVTKFRGYYDENKWREVVLTMLTYGAIIPADDVQKIVSYLSEHLGPGGGDK